MAEFTNRLGFWSLRNVTDEHINTFWNEVNRVRPEMPTYILKSLPRPFLKILDTLAWLGWCDAQRLAEKIYMRSECKEVYDQFIQMKNRVDEQANPDVIMIIQPTPVRAKLFPHIIPYFILDRNMVPKYSALPIQTSDLVAISGLARRDASRPSHRNITSFFHEYAIKNLQHPPLLLRKRSRSEASASNSGSTCTSDVTSRPRRVCASLLSNQMLSSCCEPAVPSPSLTSDAAQLSEPFEVTSRGMEDPRFVKRSRTRMQRTDSTSSVSLTSAPKESLTRNMTCVVTRNAAKAKKEPVKKPSRAWR